MLAMYQLGSSLRGHRVNHGYPLIIVRDSTSKERHESVIDGINSLREKGHTISHVPYHEKVVFGNNFPLAIPCFSTCAHL